MYDCYNGCTFTLASTTTTLYLPKPYWKSPNDSFQKQIKLFDFWDEDFDTVDTGMQNQPLTFSGELPYCGDFRICEFPICFPICGDIDRMNLIKDIWAMQNNHDEVTITDLHDSLDAVYIIKDFKIEASNKIKRGLTYTITLELVRRS